MWSSTRLCSMTITFVIIIKKFIICISNFVRDNKCFYHMQALLWSLFANKRSRVNLLDCWLGRVGILGWDSQIFMVKVKIPMYLWIIFWLRLKTTIIFHLKSIIWPEAAPILSLIYNDGWPPSTIPTCLFRCLSSRQIKDIGCVNSDS